MANRSFYHWVDTNVVKTQFSRWPLEEQRTDEELKKKVSIASENYYKHTWSSIALLDKVVHSTLSELKEKEEEFLTQLLKQDQTIYDMLVDLQNKRKK
ncbi:hypothetical protein Hanom_Chr13g01222241 [Helianthus anomalus]